MLILTVTMALYDNQHWTLSLIRDNFISVDYSGMLESLLLSDNIPKQLKAKGVLRSYPGEEDSDEDLDHLAESYEIEMDMRIYSRKERTNTAATLEKMEQEKKEASKVKSIKWELDPNITLKEQQQFFPRKDFRNQNTENDSKKHSKFTEELEKCPAPKQNPFVDYVKFDGSAQFDEPTKEFRIFLFVLPKESRDYPLQLSVIASATVREFIGLICYKYTIEHPNEKFQEDIHTLGLYITEDDDIDWDFPCLDPTEPISTFFFNTLGLAEMKTSDKSRYANLKTSKKLKKVDSYEATHEVHEVAKDLAMMEIHTTAMEAPLYQLYRVNIVNKVRAKTEVHLGISGDKIEIDPVVTSKGASRFWNRQRPVNHHIDNVAWCEVTESKGSKTAFSIVYTLQTSRNLEGLNVSLGNHSLRRSTSFKNHDFEADTATAIEIVRKINNILELRNSCSRKDYMAQKERKAARRKSFHAPHFTYSPRTPLFST